MALMQPESSPKILKSNAEIPETLPNVRLNTDFLKVDPQRC